MRPIQQPLRALSLRFGLRSRNYTASGGSSPPSASPSSPKAGPGSGRTTSRLGQKVLSLDHFLQRARALALYREILRGTRGIADAGARDETRRYARAEFERRRGVDDLDHARYLLSTGRAEWEGMEPYVRGMSQFGSKP